MSGGSADAKTRTELDGVPGPLVIHEPSDCHECWGCVRVCPARAIRVVDGKSEVIEERCVKCGACATSCGHSSHRIRDDLPRVRDLLSSGRPVAMLLATEVVAAMWPLTVAEVERALEAIGFASVETTALGEELVAVAYEKVGAGIPGAFPRLRSTCPVVVEWVRRFHPQLTDALMPVVPPYIAQARLMRTVYKPGTAIVYASPCYARKDEVYDPQVADAVDVAIDFEELRRLIDETPIAEPLEPGTVPRRAHVVKQLSLTDGFPRRLVSDRAHTSRDLVTVRGLTELEELLDAISRGDAAPAIVDMLLCDGCLDGPAVNRDLSVWAKRSIASGERDRAGRPVVDGRDLVGTLPKVEMSRSFSPLPSLRPVPTDEQIDEELRNGEFESREATIDCGACGYPTCVDHAAAVVMQDSSWDMCFPLQRRKMQRQRAELEHAASRDMLTGLYNRRAFDERIVEEVARAKRYDAPLSLVMIDLDNFKLVNDRHGHPMGDVVLREMGRILKAVLRSTDLAVRYGGDEFALVLPGTAKTEAWAVAEKLRAVLRDQPVEVGPGVAWTIHASMGIASFGPAAPDEIALLEAADRALYAAKSSGRDRVQLAPG